MADSEDGPGIQGMVASSPGGMMMRTEDFIRLRSMGVDFGERYANPAETAEGLSMEWQDDFLWSTMLLWPGGDNVRATDTGLRNMYRCHICGMKGGH